MFLLLHVAACTVLCGGPVLEMRVLSKFQAGGDSFF